MNANFYSGKEIYITTPGRYAMDTAIKILQYLENKHDAVIPDTGWKNGYGLEVAVEIPISLSDFTACLSTDGEELWVRRVTGSKQVYDEVMDFTYQHVSGQTLKND